MNPATSLSPRATDWRTLFRAAILENNKTLVRERVFEAEAAVLERQRELLCGGGTPEEKEALEDALYAIRAYKTAWQHTEAA